MASFNTGHESGHVTRISGWDENRNVMLYQALRQTKKPDMGAVFYDGESTRLIPPGMQRFQQGFGERRARVSREQG